MQKTRCELKRYYDQKVQVIISTSNEGRTQGNIQSMSIRLASQVQHYLSKQSNKKFSISFIGHSMGGLIIRGALPHLSQYKNLMYSFMTLSTPHTGYFYSNSKLVDAGLWVVNNWKKCQSILQLTMQDQQDIQKTHLYNLSKCEGLSWFSKITLISSRQDLYVPYSSARIQKSKDCEIDCKNKVKKGLINSQMVKNILDKIKGKLTRIDVDFMVQQQNLDNIIGRAAHISFINNYDLLRALCVCGDRLIF